MIQDDYGNLVATASTTNLYARMDIGDERMDRIELELAANTVATKEVASNTAELVGILNALKGAFKVIEFIGKLAKPLGYIVALGVAMSAVWTAAKHGGPNP